MSTASEILDEREVGTSVRMLVTACMAFTMCPQCGHVDNKMEVRRNHPCQKCGIPVDCRRILFSTQTRLLEMIFEGYQSAKSNEMCVLLFCALIEQHLLELLKSRCIRLKIEWPVMELLLDGYEKVHERLKLFERLTGVKVRDASLGNLSQACSQLTIRSTRSGTKWLTGCRARPTQLRKTTSKRR